MSRGGGRPGYLPAVAWEAATALRDRSPPLSAAEAGALGRLLDGRGMGDVWRRLAASAPDADAYEWRRLLELFVYSARGSDFRPELRGALAKAGALLSQIAGRAAALAELLNSLAEIGVQHALDLPDIDLISLLDEAGYGDAWRAHGVADLELAMDLTGALPRALIALANIAEGLLVPPDAEDARLVRPGWPHEAYAVTRKSGGVPEWVRYVDAKHRFYYAAHLPPRWRHLEHEELAAVGSAVLNLTVLPEHVRKYRGTAPADLKNCPNVIVLPQRDDSP